MENQAKLKRRSSILKVQKEEDVEDPIPPNNPARRVSFASKNAIKCFAEDEHCNTIWDNTYECHADSTGSTRSANSNSEISNFTSNVTEMNATLTNCPFNNVGKGIEDPLNILSENVLPPNLLPDKENINIHHQLMLIQKTKSVSESNINNVENFIEYSSMDLTCDSIFATVEQNKTINKEVLLKNQNFKSNKENTCKNYEHSLKSSDMTLTCQFLPCEETVYNENENMEITCKSIFATVEQNETMNKEALLQNQNFKSHKENKCKNYEQSVKSNDMTLTCQFLPTEEMVYNENENMEITCAPLNDGMNSVKLPLEEIPAQFLQSQDNDGDAINKNNFIYNKQNLTSNNMSFTCQFASVDQIIASKEKNSQKSTENVATNADNMSFTCQLASVDQIIASKEKNSQKSTENVATNADNMSFTCQLASVDQIIASKENNSQKTTENVPTNLDNMSLTCQLASVDQINASKENNSQNTTENVPTNLDNMSFTCQLASVDQINASKENNSQKTTENLPTNLDNMSFTCQLALATQNSADTSKQNDFEKSIPKLPYNLENMSFTCKMVPVNQNSANASSEIFKASVKSPSSNIEKSPSTHQISPENAFQNPSIACASTCDDQNSFKDQQDVNQIISDGTNSIKQHSTLVTNESCHKIDKYENIVEKEEHFFNSNKVTSNFSSLNKDENEEFQEKNVDHIALNKINKNFNTPTEVNILHNFNENKDSNTKILCDPDKQRNNNFDVLVDSSGIRLKNESKSTQNIIFTCQNPLPKMKITPAEQVMDISMENDEFSKTNKVIFPEDKCGKISSSMNLSNNTCSDTLQLSNIRYDPLDLYASGICAEMSNSSTTNVSNLTKDLMTAFSGEATKFQIDSRNMSPCADATHHLINARVSEADSWSNQNLFETECMELIDSQIELSCDFKPNTKTDHSNIEIDCSNNFQKSDIPQFNNLDKTQECHNTSISNHVMELLDCFEGIKSKKPVGPYEPILSFEDKRSINDQLKKHSEEIKDCKLWLQKLNLPQLPQSFFDNCAKKTKKIIKEPEIIDDIKKINETPQIKNFPENIRKAAETKGCLWRILNLDCQSVFVSTLFNIKIKIDFDGSGIVKKTEFSEKKTKEAAAKLMQFYFLKKIQNAVIGALGQSFDVLALLAYYQLILEQFKSTFILLTEKLFISHNLKIDHDNFATFSVIHVSLGLYLIFKVDCNNLDNISTDSVSIEVKNGRINEKQFFKLVSECNKGMEFLNCYIKKIEEYVNLLAEQRK